MNKEQQPVDPTALTTEQTSFNRQTGLGSVVPQLSLESWDVDPDIVRQRLTSTPERAVRE